MKELLEQLNRLEAKVDRILQYVHLEARAETEILMTLEELKKQVEANTALEASAVALIHGMAAQIAAVKSDPAAVQALADSLKASADGLASAITANTPAAPPAAPPAPPAPATPTP